jgi:flagellar biogenesis protein FliO
MDGSGMKHDGKREAAQADTSLGGLAGFLLKPLLRRLRGTARRTQPRLELLERISLAPRQSLALVEAEGRRFLVATSAEGGPAFYALESARRTALRRAPRVSW